MSVAEFCAFASLTASVGGLAVYHVCILKEIRKSIRETSRFPLFAARDQLVSIVALGKMSEDDPSWSRLYRVINFLLRLDQDLSAFDLAMRYARYLTAEEGSPDMRRRRLNVRAEDRSAGERVPEFRNVEAQVGNALGYLVMRRTSWVQRVIIYAVCAWDDWAKAVEVRRSLEHPSIESLASWRETGGITGRQIG